MKAALVFAVLMCASRICAIETAVAQEAARPAKPVKLEPAKPVKLEHAAPRPARPTPPVEIPQEFAPPQEAYAAMPESSAAAGAAAPQTPSACQGRLGSIATFRPLPDLVGAGECGASDVVLLQAVTLADRTKVPLAPPATLRCTMAEAIAHWVREDVAPAVNKLGAPLRGVDNYDSYECRGRNRIRGATLSEHGRANALDVRGFRLADGRTAGLTDVNMAKDWRDGMRAGACARFSTVLGPGSDGAHEEHIHLDLAERRNNYKVCEWDVREPPRLPRPAEAETETEEAAPQQEATASQLDENVPLPRARPLAANTARARHAEPARN